MRALRFAFAIVGALACSSASTSPQVLLNVCRCALLVIPHSATSNDAFIAAVGADNDDKSEIHPALMAECGVVVDSLDQCARIGATAPRIARGNGDHPIGMVTAVIYTWPSPSRLSNTRPAEPSPRPTSLRNAVHTQLDPSTHRVMRRRRVMRTPSRGTSSSYNI